MIRENGNVLIIADDRKFLGGIVRIIEKTTAAGVKLSVESVPFDLAAVKIKNKTPDAIIIDGDRWEKEKVADYIRKLMPKFFRPVIVCTVQHNSNYGFMNAGAMDVILKPEEDAELFSTRICQSLNRLLKKTADDLKLQAKIQTRNQGSIIAIGGSTGSTQALPVILEKLQGQYDLPPIVAVLHMPETYTKIYAEQLDKTTSFNVIEAKSGLYLKNNMVVIAKGGEHLRVFNDKEGYFITSEPGVKVSGHCPSVNVLFDSVAYCGKHKAVGVILTGMGSDGAAGMLNMKKMGSFTIGQDEESSVVYGMPRAAFENGSVRRQMSLDNIAGEIMLDLKLITKEAK